MPTGFDFMAPASTSVCRNDSKPVLQPLLPYALECICNGLARKAVTCIHVELMMKSIMHF